MSKNSDAHFKWYIEARNPLRILQRKLLVESCKGKRILDIGGGTGRTGNVLSQSRYEVTVLDKNESIMRYGQERYPHLTFIQGDAYSLPFRNGSFDEVILEEIVEHFENQEKAIDEVFRVLKPGGQVILSTPNKYLFRVYIFLLRLVTLRFDKLTEHVKSHTSELTSDELARLFTNFSEKKIIGLNPFCQFLAKRFPRLGIGLLGIFKK
jgi:ubiquinone/menaquinone biosynthesis C-methylase UbiE